MERKEWLDRLIDAEMVVNKIRNEHGAGPRDNNILIYGLHDRRFGKEDYGFMEIAEELGIVPETEFREDTEKKGVLPYRHSFTYRDYEICTYSTTIDKD